jgi:Tfp pilus assembly protein PilF
MSLIKETDELYMLKHNNKNIYLLKESDEHITIGNKLVLESNYLGAINQYKQTKNSISYNNIGVVKTLLNQFDLMAQYYTRSCCAYSYLNLANNTIDKKNVLNYYTIANTLNKTNSDVIFDMAKYYEYSENNLDQAVKYYKMLCDNLDYKSEVLYTLAIIFYDYYGEYDNFVKYSLLLLSCDNDDYVKTGRHNLGEYYFDMFNQTLDDSYRELMFKYLDPSHSCSAYLIGFYFTNVQIMDKAEEYLKVAISQNNHEAANLLGEIYEIEKKNKLAEDCYKKAIAICDSVEAYYNLALLYLRDKKYVFAEQILFKLIYQKNDVNSMLILADYYSDIKKNDVIAKKYYIMNYQITKNVNVLKKIKLELSDIELITRRPLSQNQLVSIINSANTLIKN